MPMSTTRTPPAWARPGSNNNPGFRAAKHTVSSARTAAPRASPVSPSTPDGISTLNVRVAEIARAPEAGTEHRVDGEVRTSDGARQLADSDAVGEREDVDPDAPCPQKARC